MSYYSYSYRLIFIYSFSFFMLKKIHESFHFIFLSSDFFIYNQIDRKKIKKKKKFWLHFLVLSEALHLSKRSYRFLSLVLK